MSIASTGASHWEGGPLTVTVKQARAITGLGHTTIYRLITEGKLKTAKVYGRRLIIFTSIEELIEEASE